MAIHINGGLGRVVASLPALKASGDLVIASAFHELFSLTDITAIEAQSVFLPEALKGHDVITPEPYHLADYREGKINFNEAFNKLLNVEGDDYGLCADENITAKLRHDLSSHVKGKQVVIIQSVATSSIRSMPEVVVKNAIQAVRELDMVPVLVGTAVNFDHDCVCINEGSIIEYVSAISIGSYFIGCDSSGMHIARALNIPGAIYLTSTAGIKYYPDHFTEFKNKNHPNTVEHPRLFSDEIQRSRVNDRLNLHHVVSVDDFKSAIESTFK